MDDHPICRRCGYDLFGSPPDAAVCPECGSDLRAKRAVTTARQVRTRRRRRTLTFACVVVGLFAVGASVYVAHKWDWKEVKPVWMLRREARVTSTHDEAMAILMDRLKRGRLSRSQVDALAGDGLAAQADPKRPWLSTWGDFIEEAHLGGKLADARWKQYVEQMLAIAVPDSALSVPPLLGREARTIPVVVTYKPTRCGSPRGPVALLYLQTTVQAVAGDVLTAKQYKSQIEHPLQMAGGDAPQPYQAALDPAKVAAAGAAPHTIKIVVEALVSDVPDFFVKQERYPGRFKPVLVKRFEFTGTWRLIMPASRATTATRTFARSTTTTTTATP